MPICFIGTNEVLLSKLNRIYVYELQTGNIRYLVSLRSSFKQNVLGRIHLSKRLLRLGVRYGTLINDNTVLLVYDQSIFELDFRNFSIIKSFSLAQDNRPLNIAVIRNINGFNDMVCFGEYYGNGNPKQKAVNIYGKTEVNDWKIIFTFPNGSIDHVHSIVPDKYNDCVWILTGDFGNAAAIWIAKDNFSIVYPVGIGKQIFRSVVAFPTPDGLLYGTDSQFELNTIRLLIKSDEKWISRSLCEVNGPVCYGCKVKDDFVFSTSVEGMSTAKKGILKYLDTEIGDGVKENYSHIVIGNIKSGFNTIYKNRKDFLPFVLFQFGIIQFPTGYNDSNLLIFHNTALENNNLSTCITELSESNVNPSSLSSP